MKQSEGLKWVDSRCCVDPNKILLSDWPKGRMRRFDKKTTEAEHEGMQIENVFGVEHTKRFRSEIPDRQY